MKIKKIVILILAAALIIFFGEVLGSGDFDKFQKYDYHYRAQEGELWGLKNADNEWVIDPQYMDIGSYTNGLVSVSEDGITWGYADIDNDMVIEPNEEYVSVTSFSAKGYATVINASGEMAKIDTKGNYLIDFQPMFTYASSFSDNNLALIKSIDGTKYGYADRMGKIIINMDYTYGSMFADNDIACVGTDDGRFFIDSTGSKAFDSVFENAFMFTDSGLALAKVDGKWGYIDSSGEFVIEPKYDWAESFTKQNNDIARVTYTKDGEEISCTIDTQGNETK